MSHIKDIIDKLKQGKHNLKKGFPQHCLYHSSCLSQCISFTISYPDNQSLMRLHLFNFEGHGSKRAES